MCVVCRYNIVQWHCVTRPVLVHRSIVVNPCRDQSVAGCRALQEGGDDGDGGDDAGGWDREEERKERVPMDLSEFLMRLVMDRLQRTVVWLEEKHAQLEQFKDDVEKWSDNVEESVDRFIGDIEDWSDGLPKGTSYKKKMLEKARDTTQGKEKAKRTESLGTGR